MIKNGSPPSSAVDALATVTSKLSVHPGFALPHQPAPLGRWNDERILTWLVLAFLAVICLLPIARLLYEVASALVGPQRGVVVSAVTSSAAWTATRHSLEVGLLGGLVATVYGLFMATLVTLTKIRYRQMLVFGFVAQAMLPAQVVALAWLQLWMPMRDALVSMGLQSASAWGNPLQTREGIVFLLGIHFAPLVFLTVRAALLNVPPDVVEAARVCGARPTQVIRKVIWPLITPALASGAALAFVSCIGNFGIPAFLGIPGDYLVLPTLIYRELSGFGPSVIPNVVMLSVLVAVLAGLGVVAQHLCIRRGHYRVVTVRYPEPPFSLGASRVWLELFTGCLIALLLIVPMLALLADSISQAPGVSVTPDTATLAHYVYVLSGNEATARAFVNSTVLAFGAAFILAAVSLFLAYLIQYRQNSLFIKLERVIEIPYVIPGVVLAMAMILLYLLPLPFLNVSLYNTLGIIFIAYLARFLTVQLRPVISGFQQFPTEMLEAAEIFGASFRRRMRQIVLPSLLPSITAGATLVVLLAMNELTISALLWATGTETLGVAVFSLEQGGESAAASAIGVLTVLITVSLMLLASLAGRRLPSGVLPWRA